MRDTTKRRSGGTTRGRAGGRRLGAAAVVALAAIGTAAFGRPEGHEVVYGDVRFVFDGLHTTIYASDGSIINYLNFNIGPQELVQFVQPHEAARVLNRINSVNPTVIQGRLMANGQVYLINPSGVLFTPTAVVDANGLFAAAGSMTNQDFLEGVNRFHSLSGDVVNEGLLRGGRINLLGNRVANHGAIRADHGLVAMVAGNEVLLREHDGHIFARVDGTQLTDLDAPLSGTTAPDMQAMPGVENTGEIRAHHGQVFLGAGDHYALAIHNVGSIHGRRADVQMVAADGLIHNAGVVDVSNHHRAGDITVQGPSVLNDGVLRADSEHGTAGSIEVTSQHHTYLRDGSVISAAGTDDAHGGDVLVHSYDGSTAFADGAVIDVSGGLLGGHGGFVEVSGRGLTFNGDVLLNSAAAYRPGTLLIDPHHIYIRATGANDDFLDDSTITFDEGGPDLDVIIGADTLARIVGEIRLEATGSIVVQAEVNLLHNNDLLFTANKLVSIQAAINGANNFIAHADYDNDGFGWVSVNQSLELTGYLDFTGTDIILNNDISIVTAGSQNYHGRVQVGGPVTMAGTEIHFMNTVDSKFINEPSANNPLTINITAGNGFVRFTDAVGATSALRSIEVNGLAKLQGGSVTTNDFQLWNGPVRLEDPAVLSSLGAGGITFASIVLGDAHLTVNTAGQTRFEGPVGEFIPLRSVTTDAEGTTTIAADFVAGTVTLNDPVTLASSVEITGTEAVTFGSTVDGDGHDLLVTSPATTFVDTVSDVGFLTTDAAGATFITADITAEGLDFQDVVELIGDTHLTGVQFVRFGGTIDGPHDLEIDSDGIVSLGGDIGGDVALAVADIDGLLILIEGELIRADGDIRLQESGVDGIPILATIGAFNSLTLRSLNGDIFLGRNSKLTVAGGDFAAIAPNGTFTVGDLNVNGDATVIAPNIQVWRRPPGQVELPDGTMVSDEGTDIVVAGSITVSATENGEGEPMVIFIGEGRDPIVSSGAGLAQLLASLLESRPNTGLSPEAFRTLTAILDLRAPSLGGGIGSSLAEAIPPLPQPIDDYTPREPFTLQPLQRLAMYVRGMDDGELRGALTGRIFLDDTTDTPRIGSEPQTVATRLRRDSVLAVVARYGELFSAAEDAEGDPADQAEHIRGVLSDAWGAFAAEHAENPDAGTFRSFCERNGDPETLIYIDGLGDLFREMWIMGATKRELRRSLNDVLDPICPDTMTVGDLETAIGADEIG